jgi:hypothetical protein
VNVTVNETVNGRAKISERERTGACLAVGTRLCPSACATNLLPSINDVADQTSPRDHRVFEFSKNAWLNSVFPAERLSLGQWTSISGAAFSTGLGSRTHTGLSFLARFIGGTARPKAVVILSAMLQGESPSARDPWHGGC